jgi:flagellar biosynthesis protein FlhG
VQRHEPDDQASGLRRLLGDRNTMRILGIFGPDAELNAIAAANLALALNLRGDKVCLIDEAPAPHNAISLSSQSPGYGLADVALGRLALDEAMTVPHDGLHLLKAPQGFDCAAETNDRIWNRIGEDFVRHDWEWLLLAAPADDRSSLALATPLRLLVLPAVKSRLPEAYVILKAAHNRQPDCHWLVLFMNTDDDGKVDQIMASLNETARQFLGIELELLGAIPKDAQLDAATRALHLVLEHAPGAPAAHAIRQAAARLHDKPAMTASLDARIFWQRMGLLSRMNQPPRYPKQNAQHGRAYG